MIGTRGFGEAIVCALGLCGALLFVAGVVHIPITPATAAVVALIPIAVSIPRTRDKVPFVLAPSLIALIPIAIVTYAAIIVPLHDFDGRAFWLLKAKGIAHDHAIDGPFFQGQEVVDPRNDYPLLVPLDAAAVMLIGGTLDDRSVRLLYVVAFIGLVMLVRERVGKLVSPEAGAWCAALVAWIPQFAVVNEGGALSAYCDIPLAAFVAAAFFELIADKSPARFGMWLSFIALTKNEGLPLALVLFIAGIIAFRQWIVVSVLPLIVTLDALFAWKHRVPHGAEEDLAKLLPTLPHQLHRLGGAVAGFARHLVTAPWGVFWLGVFAALIVLAWKKQRRDFALLAVVIGGAFATYIAAYTVTTWVQIDLINSSADRLLMHVVGPGVYAIALSLCVKGKGEPHHRDTETQRRTEV